jgi:hypothetical protein
MMNWNFAALHLYKYTLFAMLDAMIYSLYCGSGFYRCFKTIFTARRLQPALFFLCAVLFSCASSGTDMREPLAVRPPVIYVTNDIHYFSEKLHDDDFQYRAVANQRDGKFTEFIDPVTQAFAAAAVAGKPDIVLVNGDLTFNGEKASHRDLAGYFAQIEEAGVKVYVIPGNHDILNPNAAQFFEFFTFHADYVTPKEFREIYKDFGYGEAVSRDSASLSYIAEPVKGLRLLMIDSCKYENNERQGYAEAGGSVREATKKWIRANVLKARKAGCVIVAAMHHNLIDHPPMTGENFVIDNSGEIRELLSSLGVSFILSGHIHAQSVSGQDGGIDGSPAKFYDAATGALSVYPHQFGVLEYQPEAGAWHYTVKRLDVESWARETNQTDVRLFDFSARSAAFFSRTAESTVGRRIAGAPVTNEEAAALARLIALVNMRYFAGAAAENSTDGAILGSAAYTLLKSGRFDSLAAYVDTILNDAPQNNVDALFPASGGL